MEQGKTKFIRVKGRVVPIKADKYKPQGGTGAKAPHKGRGELSVKKQKNLKKLSKRTNSGNAARGALFGVALESGISLSGGRFSKARMIGGVLGGAIGGLAGGAIGRSMAKDKLSENYGKKGASAKRTRNRNSTGF